MAAWLTYVEFVHSDGVRDTGIGMNISSSIYQ